MHHNLILQGCNRIQGLEAAAVQI